ncbi:MAG: cation transporter [Gemmatimonadetes bacterium]|nr:cation transporter [Gemmatimonadota bacterium]
MRRVSLAVQGMKCDGCTSSVSEALAAVAGVESVDVQLGESRASLVVANETSDEALVAAVEAAGFGASPA